MINLTVQQLEQQKKANRKSDAYDEKKNHRKSEFNELLLLKEWDLDKIFKGFSDRLDQIKQESNRKESNDTITTECRQQLNNKLVESDKGKQRKNESDSKFSEGYDFKKENSDFFSSGSRHSAIFLETKPIFGKNDGVFSRSRRSSETTSLGLGKKSDTEHILSEYTDNNTNSSFDFAKEKTLRSKDSPKSKILNSICDFKKTDAQLPSRPRREKTDGEIVLRARNEKKLDLREELEAKRLDVEERFSRDAERIQRRWNLPVESFEGGNVNGGFSESFNDFKTSLNSLSFSDLQAQVSFYFFFFIPCFRLR